jgi:E3 ubiquitin-protein ligase UBR7
VTGQKGDVKGEEPAKGNTYNQNFKNRFCGCGQDYDAHQEKGTMFQCFGLGTIENGGCGEDWWHPECLVGYTREEYAKTIEKAEENKSGNELGKTGKTSVKEESAAETVPTETANGNPEDGPPPNADDEDDDPPLPPGFPAEDDFDHFLCYKCVKANPWIKNYAGSPGFLPPVYNDKALNTTPSTEAATTTLDSTNSESRKRKASEGDEDGSTTATLAAPAPPKRQKSEDPSIVLSNIPEHTTVGSTLPKVPDHTVCKMASLPPLPAPALIHPISLFLKPDFREHLCRCAEHFPLLKPYPQLLEEEDTYEPPISEEGDDAAQSVGTGSILDRGEAAFNNMDRVRAIQGAMAYAQLKDKVSAFLKPFAESGQAVGAEDVKAYFEKLRGDAQGIEDAAVGAKAGREDEDEGGDGGDSRKEQSGY